MTAYGRIKRLFLHKLYPDEGAREEVVAECDWYDAVGTNPISGNVQISPNSNFDACRMVFIKNCQAHNCVYWPSSLPSRAPPTLFDVIMHHELRDE